ncbi:hypothetical protein [Lachnotalea sp. AF33-28]|uniref:hypothetical protein n=1 Tax=Lachnotalea sp. AF33-28 TaxID=2292046 RepID=UPI00131486E7|nr:hypothetical protein [Lachnotalea sp. AF33-28]
MCAQVINLAVGDSCCALHGARAGPNEDHTLPSLTREFFGNCEQQRYFIDINNLKQYFY